jgi:hypothetical protein
VLDGTPSPRTWVAGATGALYSAFLVDEEGTASSFRGPREVVATQGLFCSLYIDRGSHYFFTPAAKARRTFAHPSRLPRDNQGESPLSLIQNVAL